MITKEKKQKILEDLKEKVVRQKSIVFMDFTGLSVKDLTSLRMQLKTAGNELKVAKKTLIQLALKEKGIESNIKDIKAEIAIALGYNDEVTTAKTVWQFANTNPKLKILGGVLENKMIKTEEVVNLAQLPTMNELLGRLVGTIAAPISNFVSVLQGNIKGLVYALSAIKDSKQ